MLLADEAQRWLRSGRDADKPFFLFVCFHEPHEPIASAPEFTGLYQSDDPSLLAHHGNVSQLDAGFATLLETLDELSLRDQTFVFLTSDNGPAITAMHPHGSSGPLRDQKGAIYEGGIRVPGIIQWPGHVVPGSVSHTPVSGVDLLPTLCEMTATPKPSDRVLDGASFLPVLGNQPIARSKPLYWQFNRAKSQAKVAIRQGDWKLVASLNTPDRPAGGGIPEDEMLQIKSAELVDFELFNLREDIAESANVAAHHRQVFDELKSKMASMYAEIQSEAPQWPVWEWPKYESQRIVWPDYWLNRKRQP
jgi:arylsulfatase A